jgi:hypothetical protein
VNEEGSMMNTMLKTTAVMEIPTGIALLAVPAWLASILLGAPLDTSPGLAVARLAGAAILSLGVVCWVGSGDSRSRATIGIVAAMLLYNLIAVAVLVSARFWLGMIGMGLMPVASMHAGLAVWCMACLRVACSQGDHPGVNAQPHGGATG